MLWILAVFGAEIHVLSVPQARLHCGSINSIQKSKNAISSVKFEISSLIFRNFEPIFGLNHVKL